MRILTGGRSVADLVRPGDTVVWGQGPGAPLSLIADLMVNRARVGNRFAVFCGFATGIRLSVELADVVDFRALGAFGDLRKLADAEVLDIIPAHMSAIPGLFASGALPPDVVLVQLTPPDDDGWHSFGVAAQHLPEAIEHARVVVAEINDSLPYTYGSRVHTSRIDACVYSSRPPQELGPAPTTSAVDRIADLIAAEIPPDPTLQFGVGALPNAVLSRLYGRADLRIRSGMITDHVAELFPRDSGSRFRPDLVVTAAAFGSRSLYAWLDRNEDVQVTGLSGTNDVPLLGRIPRLVSVNGALEVDLTGQVNAECVRGSYRGGVGGQVDLVRATRASEGGLSFIALPSRSPAGDPSIVRALSGPVTTSRSDVDRIVTEYGVAELWGQSLSERGALLRDLAHPDDRPGLM